MKILCTTDTSDDGYRGLEVVAKIIDPSVIDEIKILMVTWPVRESKIWDRAEALWLVEHDLHQAMQVAVERQLERFENLLRGCAKRIVAVSDAGEPSGTVLEHAASMNADLILLAITTDPSATAVSNVASRVLAKSRVPVVVVHGTASSL